MSMADDIDYFDYELIYTNNTSDNDRYWTTLKGERIPIFRLEDSHLLNIIKKLEREGRTVPYEMLKERHIRKL